MRLVQFLFLSPAAALEALFAPGVLNQDSPHGLSGRSEEVGTVLPLAGAGTAQAQPRFVDESGRLQGMPLGLGGHLRRGDAFQLVVNQGQQRLRGFVFTTLERLENPGDFAHSMQP